jgi:hypothetical protein
VFIKSIGHNLQERRKRRSNEIWKYKCNTHHKKTVMEKGKIQKKQKIFTLYKNENKAFNKGTVLMRATQISNKN